MKIIKKSNFPQFEGQLVQACREGETVVMPFDTVYGLIASPFIDSSMDKLYEIKGRDFEKPVSLVFSSTEQLLNFIRMTDKQEDLVSKATPGAYTFILPFDIRDREKFSDRYKKLEKIGVRIPDDKFVLDFIEEVGHPIAATSANLSGMPNCWSADDFLEQVKSSPNKPDYIIDGGTIIKTPPSDIVDISNINEPKVLRR